MVNSKPVPFLHPILIADLRPTQITVGMREVEIKRREWRALAPAKADAFLGRHMIPVIHGPKDRLYAIDHHHLARALHEEGVTHVLVSTVADLRRLDKDDFFVFLDKRGWLHPFDADGHRQGYDALPKGVGQLADDPYRSLAGELRTSGGFAKDATPFSEFLWADALRRRIKKKLVTDEFDKALGEALIFAHSLESDFLPGWCGPHDRPAATAPQASFSADTAL